MAVAIGSWLQRDLGQPFSSTDDFFALYLWLWAFSAPQLLGLRFRLQFEFGCFSVAVWL
jgi:hypothetical protein